MDTKNQEFQKAAMSAYNEFCAKSACNKEYKTIDVFLAGFMHGAEFKSEGGANILMSPIS